MKNQEIQAGGRIGATRFNKTKVTRNSASPTACAS